jgi:hypothetical protein
MDANIMNDVMNHILNESNKKNEELYKNVINNITNENDIDINKFNKNVITSIENILILHFKNYDICKENNAYKLAQLYMNYNYFKQHLVVVNIHISGKLYCADKATWIIKEYIKFLKTNKPFDIPEIREYYMPKTGNGELWIRYINSLFQLYHGNSIQYLKCLKIILYSC